MKTISTLLIAVLFGTGCYTQVKSSGDYWGYTGTHEREKVAVVPNQEDTAIYPDSAGYAEDMRSRDDGGYSSGDVYDDNYYNAPNWGYYNAPYVSFSLGFGCARPWWNIGYDAYYPYWYPRFYDPYWDWYYQPGFSPYGCIGAGYPYSASYGFYSPYRYGYGEHFGYRNYGSYNGSHRYGSNVRTGRITGGDSRTRGSASSGNSGNGSSTRSGDFGRNSSGSSSGVGTRSGTTPRGNTGRSQQVRESGGGTDQNSRTRESAAPARSNDNAAPTRSNDNVSPGRGSGSNRGGSRSENWMSSPRNNPRLIPQQAGTRVAVAQSSAPRGFRGGYRSTRSSGSYPGSTGSYGNGYRGGGGAAGHQNTGRNGSREGGHENRGR